MSGEGPAGLENGLRVEDEARLREAYLFLSLLQAAAGSSVMTRLEGRSPAIVIDLEPERLCAELGLSGKMREAYLKLRAEYEYEAALRRLVEAGARVETPLDPGYPERLRNIPDPPPALFRKGDRPAGKTEEYDQPPAVAPAVAIVGSRKASASGIDIAGELGRELGRRGVRVISGLALGIDAAAHAGALEAGGETFGVLGCGIDVVYPRRNASLFERVRRSGCILSEYPTGEAPLPWRFPARNRIIAGLAEVVVVVEAAERSGALITARHALEQGGEVWAVPGPARAPGCRGSNKLLSDGAGVLWDVREFAEYAAPEPLALSSESLDSPQLVPNELPPDERRALLGVGWEPTVVDSIAGSSGLGVKEVLSALAMLELKGYVARSPGNSYVRRGGG